MLLCMSPRVQKCLYIVSVHSCAVYLFFSVPLFIFTFHTHRHIYIYLSIYIEYNVT